MVKSTRFKESRFNGRERDMREKIEKLTGTLNLLSQGDYLKICYNAGPKLANFFLVAADHACMQGERLHFLHEALGSNLYTQTMDAVFLLENMILAGTLTQDNILELHNQGQFDAFVRAYGILDALEADEKNKN